MCPDTHPFEYETCKKRGGGGIPQKMLPHAWPENLKNTPEIKIETPYPLGATPIMRADIFAIKHP